MRALLPQSQLSGVLAFRLVVIRWVWGKPSSELQQISIRNYFAFMLISIFTKKQIGLFLCMGLRVSHNLLVSLSVVGVLFRLACHIAAWAGSDQS